VVLASFGHGAALCAHWEAEGCGAGLQVAAFGRGLGKALDGFAWFRLREQGECREAEVLTVQQQEVI
jgi:hypothetical protein